MLINCRSFSRSLLFSRMRDFAHLEQKDGWLRCSIFPISFWRKPNGLKSDLPEVFRHIQSFCLYFSPFTSVFFLFNATDQSIFYY
jgi:hypothetical protein